MIRGWLFAALISCSSLAWATPEPLVVRHLRPQSPTDVRNEYFVSVLRLALEKTEATDGPFRLEPVRVSVTQQTAVAGLEKVGFESGLGVLWTMTSKEREEKLLPVRIPLLKGLLGHRGLLIRKADQTRFDGVAGIQDLAKLTAGQGNSWPDTGILRANGLPVTAMKGYDSLFFGLANGRFDYFPRGITEIGPEVEAHGDKGLVMEKHLLLYYPAPIYFFVNRDDAALADRLERGLRRAIDDGSFDELFSGEPAHRTAVTMCGDASRTVLKLDNPLLPAETPLDEIGLWICR